MAKIPAKETPAKPVKKSEAPTVKVKVIGPNNSSGKVTLDKAIKRGLPPGPKIPTPPGPTPGGDELLVGKTKPKK